jgi:PAS domain S-box-containing protein
MIFINAFGRVVWANRRCAELSGYSVEELTAPDFDFMRLIAPESRAAVGEAYQRHVRGEEVDPYEIVTLTKDGRRVTTMLATWISEYQGRCAIFGIQADISDRRRAEQALQKSEERYRALVEGIPDGIAFEALDGSILTANQASADLLGLAHVDELKRLGPQSVQLIVPEHRQAVAEATRRVLAHGGVERVIIDLVRTDGAVVPVETRVAALRDERGTPTSFITVTRDLRPQREAERQRRELEARVQHAQRLESLGVLAGGIAHDFNNLLVGILGHASLALTELSADAPARASLEKIAAAARSAATLTNQMLAYSGRGLVRKQRLVLPEVVGDLGPLLGAALPKGVRIEITTGGELPPVAADLAQVQQVVMNLITNAGEAMAEAGGSIRVDLAAIHAEEPPPLAGWVVGPPAPGTYVCLSVADSGRGIEAATLERIFDPFFTTKHGGRGLGLSAVLGIVRGHGGALRVESRPGSGSTFAVYLPALVGAEAEATTAPPTSLPAEWPGGAVLVADDEAVVRSVVQSILERQGFSVLLAEDGHQAVEIAQTRGSTLRAALLDLTMPRVDGEAACLAIRALLPGLPIILSSGYPAAEAGARFQRAGATAFLQKPYAAEDLLLCLAQAILPATAPGSTTTSSR